MKKKKITIMTPSGPITQEIGPSHEAYGKTVDRVFLANKSQGYEGFGQVILREVK